MQLVSLTFGVMLFLIGGVFALWCNVLMSKVLNEVNAASLTEEKISPFFIHRNLEKVLSQHALLFPDSPRRKQMNILQMAAAVFVIVGIVLATSSLVR